MSSSDQYPTKPTTGDLAHTITKVGLSAIPVIGGPAVEVFQFLMQAPIARRRDIFIQQLGEKFLELEANGIKLEHLQQNEQFISAVLQITQTALRTHQAEKLAALRNAIANLAQGQSPDETLLYVLLSHVDALSEMHIRLLKLFQAPKVPPQWIGDGERRSVSQMVSYNIPELERNAIATQLLIDLNTRGLLAADLQVGLLGEELRQPFVTGLGESLIRLITSP